jgi:hypothetical protein
MCRKIRCDEKFCKVLGFWVYLNQAPKRTAPRLVCLASSHQGAEGGSGSGTGTGSESYLGHRGHRVSVPNISTRVVTQSLLNNRVCKIRRI